MYQFDFGRIFIEQLLELRCKFRAIPSLEFAEYRDGDGRVGIALKM